jgi:autotransporter-associated beta strand protein/T5SS/PEP-CTERM-associated repeat protein
MPDVRALSRPLGLVAFVASLLAFWAEPLVAATTTYTGVWAGGTIAPSDTVVLNNGARVGGNVVTNGTLQFNATGSLTISSTISGTGNLSLTNTGTLNLRTNSNVVSMNLTTTASSGALQICSGTGELRIGNAGRGFLNIEGGSVFVKDSYLGYLNGNLGSVSISSGTWVNSGNIKVGNVGDGELNINGGLVIVGGTFSRGIDARIFLNAGGTLQIGTGGTSGVLDWSRAVNNGTLIFNRADASQYIGSIEGTGTVRKQGRGALSMPNGHMDYITVVEEGTLSIVHLSVGRSDTGALFVNGGNVSNYSSIVGFGPGSVGTVQVSSGTWASSSSLTVGHEGAGLVEVNGGRVTNGSFYIGSSNGSAGTVKMSGGSSYTIGFFYVGNAGSGELLITGGTVSCKDSDIGVSYDGIGAVSVSDGSWDSDGGLSVGRAGVGALTIGGGSVTNTWASIGRDLGSVGTASVSGGKWSCSDDLSVGVSGAGTLNMNGGMVSSTNGTLGNNTGGSGVATVTGGTWANTKELTIGRNGTGTLVVNGGNVSCYNGFIGSSDSGAVISSGTWIIQNYLQVGSLSGFLWNGSLSLAGGTVTSRISDIGTAYFESPGNIGTVAVSSGTWFNSGDLTVGSRIVGSLIGGSLDISGGLVVVGGSLYRGDLGTINLRAGGTLQIGTGGTTGRLMSHMVVDGTLVFNRSDTTTYSGVITGNGAIVKQGSGTLLFTGANSFTGHTTVGSGTLQIGSGGTTGVITGDVVNNSVLVFNRADSLTYSGVISGSGAFAKRGAGVLSLSGPNTLTGPTTIQQGTVQLAHASALAASTISPLAGGVLSLSPYLQATVGGLNPNAGGLIDIRTGRITVTNELSQLSLVAALQSGRAGGSWTGSSGITSSAAASSNGTRSVGWLKNGNGAVTCAYAAPGDSNLDSRVDILDAGNFIAFGKFDTGLPADWLEGDFNYDAVVDILDAADFFATGLYDAVDMVTGANYARNYNAAVGTVAAVPEPSVLGMFGVGAGVASLMAMRRKRAA